jgi:thiamine-monophosphate kinase
MVTLSHTWTLCDHLCPLRSQGSGKKPVSVLWGSHLHRRWGMPSLAGYEQPAQEVSITIGELGEFGLIAAMAARMPTAPDAIVGIGDDAAVLRVRDSRVVATTDLLVEGLHFRRDWSGPADIGCKAAARNLADVAAMGAVPEALLVGLAAPPDVPVPWARDVAAGLADEAARAGAYIIGGDLSGADRIFLAVTAIGTMAGHEPVTRGGARPSDVVAVTGRLGHSAAGFALLSAGLTEPADAVAAHRRPRPPYEAGPQAAAAGATSMIDISDGLIADLGHIAEASGVLIDIETARLDTGGLVRAAAQALGLAVEPRSHAAEPGSGVAEFGGQAAESGGHAVRPGNRATGPGSGAAEFGGHAPEQESRAVRPGGHAAEPGGHAAEPGGGHAVRAGERAAGLESGAEARSDEVPAPLRWVLTGGEDHALAATFPPNASIPTGWIVIGRVHEGEGVRVDGKIYSGRAGWRHFG